MLSSTTQDVVPLAWSQVLDAFLPRRAVARFAKFGGAVQLSRAWDTRVGAGVWSKVYCTGFDLSAFHDWEFDILKRLAQLRVEHTYRAVLLGREGAVAVRADGDSGPQVTIKTLHAGPTLSDLVRTPIATDDGLLAHPFVNAQRFLQLMRAMLVALRTVHEMHFVHCDIHGGNISIPVGDINVQGDLESPSGLCAELRVDRLKLIDFGFSVDRRAPPPTTLPFLRQGYGRKISPRFAKLLKEVDEQAQRQMPRGTRWADVMFDPVFWRQLDPNPLGALCNTDWREDIFQLGGLLADLRDGRNEFAHLGGRLVAPAAETDEARLIDMLPEAMVAAGLQEWSVAHGDLPHKGWIAQIDQVLEGVRKASIARSALLVDIRQDSFAPSRVTERQSSETVVQIVQKIQPRPQHLERAGRRHQARPLAGQGDQHSPSANDRVPERLAAFESPPTHLPTTTGDRERSALLHPRSVPNYLTGPAVPLVAGRPTERMLFVLGMFSAVGGLALFALVTENQGVTYHPADPILAAPVEILAERHTALPPAASAVLPDRSTPPPPAPIESTVAQRAAQLAKLIGVSVVNDIYSGGAAVDVELLSFEQSPTAELQLNVAIRWTGNLIGLEGYEARGRILVAANATAEPHLGRDATWVQT